MLCYYILFLRWIHCITSILSCIKLLLGAISFFVLCFHFCFALLFSPLSLSSFFLSTKNKSENNKNMFIKLRFFSKDTLSLYYACKGSKFGFNYSFNTREGENEITKNERLRSKFIIIFLVRGPNTYNLLLNFPLQWYFKSR